MIAELFGFGMDHFIETESTCGKLPQDYRRADRVPHFSRCF